MKNLFFAAIRTTLVIAIGMLASAAVAMWMFSGKTPTSFKDLREAATEMASFRELKKQMVSRSYNEAVKIPDDFQVPAGSTSEDPNAEDADTATMEKINAEIANAQNDNQLASRNQYQKELIQLKNKMVRLQTQLDRIENQNRVLTLKISTLVKDSKVQKQ